MGGQCITDVLATEYYHVFLYFGWTPLSTSDGNQPVNEIFIDIRKELINFLKIL